MDLSWFVFWKQMYRYSTVDVWSGCFVWKVYSQDGLTAGFAMWCLSYQIRDSGMTPLVSFLGYAALLSRHDFQILDPRFFCHPDEMIPSMYMLIFFLHGDSIYQATKTIDWKEPMVERWLKRKTACPHIFDGKADAVTAQESKAGSKMWRILRPLILQLLLSWQADRL